MVLLSRLFLGNAFYLVDNLVADDRMDFFTPWTIRNRVSNKSSAIDILQERFAKGEISKEEYEERKSILQRDQQTKKK